MAETITANIAHQLGRAEARRRIADGMDGFADAIPGGAVTEKRWEEDTAFFTIEALGQRLACRLDVMDDVVVATFELPTLLSPFAGAIRNKLEEYGPKLLEA
ncbi:MAG: polyhydroxyalkanoic acid system family protein [Pseudomonadota bacterium]